MKKIVAVLLCLLMLGCIPVFASVQSNNALVYDLSGKRTNEIGVSISDLIWKEETENRLLFEDSVPKINIEDAILSEVKENENLIILDFKTDNEDNLYPEIESMNVNLNVSMPSGGMNRYIGKAYRLIYFGENFIVDSAEDVSDKITISSTHSVAFTTDKLGKYVLYFNPDVYSVTFYSDEPIYDEDNNIINEDCIYKKIENLNRQDIIDFPEIPEKENYFFTGWKVRSGSGIYFTEPQPFTASNNYGKYYASWCLESEYEPIVIKISSDEKITKGKENGKKITLKTNYGKFVEDTEFPTEWRTAYNSETDEKTKADILSEWKSKWNIVGNDDLIIETATRIDDKTVEFTLSGKGEDIYADSDIYIEFDSSLLMPEPYESNGEIIEWDDTKIKMDTDGVRAKMYRSDNALTLARQKRSTGGNGSISMRNVVFETNGGTSVKSQLVRLNDFSVKPKAPQKEGFIFVGWYTDSEYTQEFDFSQRITEDVKVFAKWEKEDASESKIILNIGEKDAIVFGITKMNDVAPKIKDDIVFLPIRFIAENLGATVEWNEKTQETTIIKDNVKIKIKIGKDIAYVNGEKILLSSPVFLENGRTYTPIGFVLEELGAKAEWEPLSGMITITK